MVGGVGFTSSEGRELPVDVLAKRLARLPQRLEFRTELQDDLRVLLVTRRAERVAEKTLQRRRLSFHVLFPPNEIGEGGRRGDGAGGARVQVACDGAAPDDFGEAKGLRCRVDAGVGLDRRASDPGEEIDVGLENRDDAVVAPDPRRVRVVDVRRAREKRRNDRAIFGERVSAIALARGRLREVAADDPGLPVSLSQAGANSLERCAEDLRRGIELADLQEGVSVA